MHDPRIDRLAEQLVRHSTRLRRGEKVLIDLYDVPEDVGIALVREARRRGAKEDDSDYPAGTAWRRRNQYKGAVLAQ